MCTCPAARLDIQKQHAGRRQATVELVRARFELLIDEIGSRISFAPAAAAGWLAGWLMLYTVDGQNGSADLSNTECHRDGEKTFAENRKPFGEIYDLFTVRTVAQ